MKRNGKRILFMLLSLAVLFLASCSEMVSMFEDDELRKDAEAMLSAVLAEDADAAYALVKDVATKEEFDPLFKELVDLTAGEEECVFTLLSAYHNTSIKNGNKVESSTAVYELQLGEQRLIAEVMHISGYEGLAGFHVSLYEETDYYSTGSLANMGDANLLQWVLLLTNLISIAVAIFALVDCCRRRFKWKVLWILIILLVFLSLGVTISPNGLNFSFWLGITSGYSALIRYGGGSVVVRLMLPVGAILYFILKNRLTRPVPPTQPYVSGQPISPAVPPQFEDSQVPPGSEG